MNMIKNKIVLVGIIVLILGVLSACSNSSEGGSSTSDSSNKKESGQVESGDGNKSIVIYSNAASNGRGDWVKAEAAKLGFDVQFVEGGGGDIANRLIAEKNKPVADVIWGLSSIDYEKFKKDDLLETYVPTWAGEVVEGLNDSEGKYHAVVQQPILMIHNSKVYNKDTAPADWPDLWNNSKFHNKYIIFNTGGGTARAILSGILVRHKDPKGEYGISQEGWDELTKFYKYGYQLKEGESPFQLLAEEKYPIIPMWFSGVKGFEAEFGADATIVSPEIGVPHLVESVAIVKGTKNLDATKEFIDWFGTAEVQAAFAKEFSTLPANKGALDGVPQDVQDAANALTVQDIDWKFVSENMDQWVQKIELQIRP